MHTCIKAVCEAITNKMASAILFPSGENLLKVIQGYDEEWGLPMCGGAIDGTHIPILAWNESRADYVNKKGITITCIEMLWKVGQAVYTM